MPLHHVARSYSLKRGQEAIGEEVTSVATETLAYWRYLDPGVTTNVSNGCRVEVA